MPWPDFNSELTLPGHPAAAALAREYARGLVALAELEAADGSAFVDAVSTACTDIIRDTQLPGEPNALLLRGVVTSSSLSLAIRERGAPFDPSAADSAGTASPLQGRDWESIRRAVDEAHWQSRGNAGMELTLIRRRPQTHIVERLPGLELLKADAPFAPEQVYVIRLFQPEDAVGISRCVYESYGYTYANADVYYPERIVHLNGTGQLVSIVAIDQSGAIVGHLALERPELGPVAESGEAVVSPAHRGRHLLERLRSHAEEKARNIGLDGIVGYPVTTHAFSQRMEEKFGAVLCGVALGQIPQATTFKGIAGEPSQQRISTMFYFKAMAPPRATVVHAPQQHRAIIGRLYAALGSEAEFRDPATASGRGHVTVKLDRTWGFGDIHVEIAGADTATEICQAKRDLIETNSVQVIYLYLPLAQPSTPALCAAAEAEGFFWSGIGPRYAKDGDMLCLQYLESALARTV